MKINIELNEEEILALIEVINRSKEIKNPKLMYQKILYNLDKRITNLVNFIIDGEFYGCTRIN